MPISKTMLRNAALPKIPRARLDQFVSGPMDGEAVNAASMATKEVLIERVRAAELGHHLGYASGALKPETLNNRRNGTSGKTVLNDDGPLRIEAPRERDASSESNQEHQCGDGLLTHAGVIKSKAIGQSCGLTTIENLASKTPAVISPAVLPPALSVVRT